MNNDEKFMLEAIKRAKVAARYGEVPIGCVIVKDGEVIASGRNMREKKNNALLHAEIVAIDKACKKLGRWRLHDCTLYVTLEPCAMCTGALINSRMQRVVFGAFDAKAGSLGSVIDLNVLPYNHKFECIGGILEEKCATLLSDFFKKLRERKK
jgi:tRNA(adenine34) deaminase